MRWEIKVIWTPTWFLFLPTATWVKCSLLIIALVVTEGQVPLHVLWLHEEWPLCLLLTGFSLDSGMSLTKKGQLTVVAGAPRANHSGAVVLLKKGPDTKYILEEEYTLEGEGLASSFGYDLTVLDLNGDGWVKQRVVTHKVQLLLWKVVY